MPRNTFFAAFVCASMLSVPALAADQPIIGAPSPIPHPVANYLPITIDKNNCLMCHREQPADRARQKGEIPRSHYAQPGKLSGERYECTLCHAESSQAKPLEPVNANDSTED